MESILEKARQLTVLKISQNVPEYKRYIFNLVKNSKSKIVGIYGARGVGKTTLLIQILKEYKYSITESLYISCDHPIFNNINLYEFLEEFYKRGGKVIFIDEIHKITDFQNHLKAAYDFLDLKIFFTGSSAVSITNPDFARRFSMFYLPVLSLREFIEIYYKVKLKSYSLEEIIQNHETIAFEIIKNIPDKILKIFDFYNQSGSYPFYFEDPDKYIDKLIELINATIYYDIGDIFGVNPDKLHSLKKILTTLCVSKPFEFSVEKLANISGIGY